MLVVGISGCNNSEQPIQVGSCLQESPADNRGHRIVTTPCDEEHYGEVVAVFIAEDGPFPGVQALADEAHATCLEAFEQVVGVPVATSVYDLLPLTPSENSWNDSGDRTVLCVARSSNNEPMVGSIAGSNR